MYVLHGKYNEVRLIEAVDWEARKEVAKVCNMKPDEISFSYSKIRIPLSVYQEEDFDLYEYIAQKWGVKDYDDLSVYVVSARQGYDHPVDAWGTVLTYFADKQSGNDYPVSKIELEEALNIIKDSNTDNKYDDMFIQFITDSWRLADVNKCKTVTGMSSKDLLYLLRYKYRIVDIYDDINEPGHFEYLLDYIPKLYRFMVDTKGVLDIVHILDMYINYYKNKPFELYEIINDSSLNTFGKEFHELDEDEWKSEVILSAIQKITFTL